MRRKSEGEEVRIMISNANWHGPSGPSEPIPKISFFCVKPPFLVWGILGPLHNVIPKKEGRRAGKNI